MPTHINLQTATPAPKTALLLGGGYVAMALTPALIERGYEVVVTTRSQEQADAIQSNGATPLLINDLDNDELRAVFERADIIVSSIPPKKSNGKDGCYDPVISVLKGAAPKATWMGYLSATSVYGDRAGRWAFEGEYPTPYLKRGKARAEAELEWVESLWPVHIFRLAGIYGSGRDPFEKLRQGDARAVIKDDHVVNRIHVEDIVTALLASIERSNPQRIYNIADGHPASPQDVLDFAAELINAQLPPRVGVDDPSVSNMARTFYSETKCIDIGRAQRELGWTPKYTNYEIGLRAILTEQESSKA